MNKLLIIGATSLVLFGVSASASYFWQQKQKNTHTPEKAEKSDTPAKEPAHAAGPASAPAPAPSQSESPSRTALRPAYNPGTEELARMTNELRSRLAAVREREEQLAGRGLGERPALDERLERRAQRLRRARHARVPAVVARKFLRSAGPCGVSTLSG